ncbi:MAG: methylmalonyl-CoA epimerase [Rikenellaceae bacterium]
MSVTHVEHIGIAVKDLDVAIPMWEKLLGVKCYNIEEVAEQKVKTAFLKIGEIKIELLQSTAEDGPIAKFIEKKGEGIQHIAFASTDIEGELARCSSEGIQLIDKTPRNGAEGLSIGFLHPKSTLGVLAELCQKKNK